MDIELTKLLISETRKSLNKLSVAEQQALAATGDNSFYHPFLHNAGYQEAVQEIKSTFILIILSSYFLLFKFYYN